MNNDVLKNILGEQYNENSIVNFLLYKQTGKAELPTPKSLFNKGYEELNHNEKQEYNKAYEEWRKKYDFDVICLDGDLNADTIFSVWMPLKMCLQCSTTYPITDVGNNKKPYICYPYIPNIIKNIDKYLPRSDWKEMYEFAELAFTDANVMRLPNRIMQRRAELYYDQMPKTLFECFKGGQFEYYFDNINVEEWVKKENLLMFFNNNSLSKQDIKPLIPTMKACEFAWLNKKSEIKKMLTNFNEILKQRKE